jgi:chromosomal replication initiation ATPase DnaA
MFQRTVRRPAEGVARSLFPSQMALPLALPADPRDDSFLVTPSNARAVHLLERWGAWQVRVAILTGPRRSGRSTLARLFAAKSGGAIIDDAHATSEEALFHAWNAAQSSGRPLLLVTDAPPPLWDVALPDLRSRLAASVHVEVGAPDDALVRSLLDYRLNRLGLDARPDLVDWLSSRIERSHLAVERTVDALDQACAERRKRLTIPLARATLIDAGLIAGKPEMP